MSKKPEEKVCPIYKAAAIIAGHITVEHPTPPDNVTIMCDGSACAFFVTFKEGCGISR